MRARGARPIAPTPAPSARRGAAAPPLGGGPLPPGARPAPPEGRSVVEWRRVTRGDRAVLAEGRLEPGQLLDRRVGADRFVALQLHAVDVDRLVAVGAAVPGGRGAAVALDRELVLSLAADVVLA